MENVLYNKKCIYLILILLICILFRVLQNTIQMKYKQDDLTLVSAYYQMKSKYSNEEYY